MRRYYAELNPDGLALEATHVLWRSASAHASTRNSESQFRAVSEMTWGSRFLWALDAACEGKESVVDNWS